MVRVGENNDFDYRAAISKSYRQLNVDSEVDGPPADTQRAGIRCFNVFPHFKMLRKMTIPSRHGFRFMVKNLFSGARHVVFVAFLLLCSTSSWAFYTTSSQSFDISLGGFIGAGGSVAKYPGNGFYAENSDASWFGDFRLLAQASAWENLTANINILQNVRSTPTFMFSGSAALPRDVQRSGLFYRQQHDSPNTQVAMVLDAAYVKYGNQNNELIIGRQPITTTVTFFFTPNDFFAPFSPNTFFRVYKPGVDALRYERMLKALSQLSVIGVLGYETSPDAESGWSNAPDWRRSTVMSRLTYSAANFEWGGIFGVVRESMVAGFSLQGELSDWLGVRAEGHYADSWADGEDSGLMATISLEHRYPSSLTLRLEYMYNGFGSGSIDGALVDRMPGRSGPGYLGRNYSAFNLSYEITPLLFGELLFLRNWSDDSYTMSFNVVYSVSDESELAFTATLPGGSEPDSGQIHSELGSLPIRFALEYRYYF